MKNFGRFTLFTVAVMLFMILPLRLVWSADENASIAQVYLEFDPATGQFVSVPATADNSPDGASGFKGGKHPAAAASTDTAGNVPAQTGAASSTAAAPQAQTTADGTVAVDANTPTTGGVSPVLIGAVVLIALGGIVMMMRKKAA
jgi:hypothetical protein